MPNIQVIFFGSHHLEHALAHYLSACQYSISLVAATNNAAELFSALKEHKPQQLLLENAPDQAPVVDLVQNVRGRFPQIKVLLLAQAIDVAQVRRLMTLGIAGYLLVDSSLDGLDITIRLINSGKLTLAAEITQALLSAQ